MKCFIKFLAHYIRSARFTRLIQVLELDLKLSRKKFFKKFGANMHLRSLHSLAHLRSLLKNTLKTSNYKKQ